MTSVYLGLTYWEWLGIVQLIFLISIFCINAYNMYFQKKVVQTGNIYEGKISVLIPARNEENNIRDCVNSVLKQKHPNFEIIVLNDNSTDATEDILNTIKDERLKILEGKALPAGWIGKNYACYQLSQAAAGEYLLFIDADTRLTSEYALQNSASFAEKNNSDLFSIFPYQECITFWEKMVIPMLHFTVYSLLPIPYVEKSPRTEFTMGNGQFMFFKRSFYDKIGGHESLKNVIIEDVAIARRVKEFGGKLIFANGTDIASCRMYTNLKDIWEGFSKNLFPGLSFSISAVLFVGISFITFFILPVFMLLAGIIYENTTLVVISGFNFFIPVVIRLLHSLKYKLPLLHSFLNFISILFIVLVGLNSLIIVKFGSGAKWKGRNYKETLSPQ